MDTSDHITHRRCTRLPEARAASDDRTASSDHRLGRTLQRLADATRAHVARVLAREGSQELRIDAVGRYRIPAAAIPALLAVLRDGWTSCVQGRRLVVGRVVKRILGDAQNVWGAELEEALGHVVTHARARCIRTAVRILRCVADAEDLVGDLELGLPGLAVWFDTEVSRPWPWLRKAVRRRCLDWLRRRARDGLRVDLDPDEIGHADGRDAVDAPEDPRAGISFDEVVIVALSSARRDAKAELLRHVAMWRDHGFARSQGNVDLGMLAQRYFGNDTKQLRNRVSQYCKRMGLRLERAARHLMSTCVIPGLGVHSRPNRTSASVSRSSQGSPSWTADEEGKDRGP